MGRSCPTVSNPSLYQGTSTSSERCRHNRLQRGGAAARGPQEPAGSAARLVSALSPIARRCRSGCLQMPPWGTEPNAPTERERSGSVGLTGQMAPHRLNAPQQQLSVDVIIIPRSTPRKSRLRLWRRSGRGSSLGHHPAAGDGRGPAVCSGNRLHELDREAHSALGVQVGPEGAWP